MPPKIACPSSARLSSLVRGSGGSSELADLASHLESCSACREKVRTLVPKETIVEHAPDDFSQIDKFANTIPPSIVDRLKKLAHGRQRSNPSTVGVPSNSTSSEAIEFLAPAAEPDEIGRLGRYRVLDVLGQGGMGMVFLAHDPDLDRRVGLKVMLPKFAANEMAKLRFLREARAAAKVKSDHIVYIHQVGEDRGVPYLAMELLEGRPLDQFLLKQPKLSLSQILRIGRDTAKGLAAAHEKGLIHRDIKPGNLWLDSSNGGRVKILDFGLARAEKEDVQMTQSGAIVGTPAYMAPEQARGTQMVDARADLFSLGCVLYRLCVGEMPFKSDTTMGILMAIATEEPTSPARTNPAIPSELSDLIMQLLDKDPAKRPATAKAVIARLGEVEQKYGTRATKNSIAGTTDVAAAAVSAPTLPADEPIVPNASAGAQKRRVPRFAIAAGFFAVVLAIAGFVFFWQTADGVVRIESKDDSIKLAFDGGEMKVIGAYEKPLSLKPGKHRLKVKHADFEFETDKLVVARGDEIKLSIQFSPGKVQLIEAKKGVLDERAIPKVDAPILSANPAPFALSFDGESNIVRFPTLERNSRMPFTVEAWARPLGENGVCFFKINGSASLQVFFDGKDAGGLEIKAKGSSREVLAKNAFDLGQWLHVAYIVAEKEARIYVNGKLKTTIEGPFSEPADPAAKGSGLGGDPLGGWNFKGDVSAVRVSKSERYHEDFVPEPRWASDSETLALYRFDEGKGDTLKDSSGNGHDGKIVGATWVRKNKTEPVQSTANPDFRDYAVFADKGSGVVIESLKLPKAGPITIEGYVTPQMTKPGEPMHLFGGGHHAVYIHDSGRWSMVWITKTGNEFFDTAPLAKTRRTHLAGVLDGRKMRLFVDGKLAAERDTGEFLPGTVDTFYIGTSRNWAGAFDEIRVSKVARYAKDFAPQVRFDPDAETLALYHCDEGKGDVLIDSSGNGHHGDLKGTGWVLSGDSEPKTEEVKPRSPRTVPGLKFSGRDQYVETLLPYLEEKPWTAEGWIVVDKVTSRGNLFNSCEFWFAQVRNDPGQPPRFSFVSGNDFVFSKEEAPLHRRQHYALTHKDGVMSLFLDGKLQGSFEAKPKMSKNYINLFPSAYTTTGIYDGFFGELDNLRYSQVVRYTKDFTPPANFVPDADTIAIYRCDEGKGDIANDSSGKNNHGKIVGAKWVK